MTVANEEVVVECAWTLRVIARELRSLGDIPLVLIDAEGVGDAGITMADELWLLALRLDPDHAYENMDDGSVRVSDSVRDQLAAIIATECGKSYLNLYRTGPYADTAAGDIADALLNAFPGLLLRPAVPVGMTARALNDIADDFAAGCGGDTRSDHVDQLRAWADAFEVAGIPPHSEKETR